MNTWMKKLTVATVVVGVAATGGVAWALWSSTGTGNATAAARSAVAITVSAATGTADLYPGFTGGDAFFTVSNTNPYQVTFTAVSAGTITSSAPVACPASNVSVSSPPSLSLTVAAGASAVPASLADVVSMASAAPDGCQGVTFTIPLTLTGAQS
jgi:hypothetical protein